MELIPCPKVKEEARNWLNLPEDVIFMILLKLGAVEILNNAQNVCSLWHKICKDPSMWRVIDMDSLSGRDLVKMCMNAIDRSCGGLVDISVKYFGTDELLHYITQSSNQLRRLRLVSCSRISDKGLIEAVSKLPLLEHLEIYLIYLRKKTLKAIGLCCPLLKSFKLNYRCSTRSREDDGEAFAIAKNMHSLSHLQIFGNQLTNRGLQAILDGCPDLESLDLRQCLNLNLKQPLGSVCAERITNLLLPGDSIDDYEYYFDESDDNMNIYDKEYLDFVNYVYSHL